MSDGGEVADPDDVDRLLIATASTSGTGYRVQRVVRNDADEIIAVEANGAHGKGLAVRARKAVVLRGTGGSP